MVKEKYLIISTVNPQKNFLGLADEDFLIIKKKIFQSQTSEVFFQNWQIFLSLKKIAKLKGIIIHQGPGSFSGLRLGVVIANNLKIAYPKINLYEVTAKDLAQFLKFIAHRKIIKVPSFIKPKYPQF